MTHTICKIGIGTSIILFTYLTISFSRENQIQVSSEGKMTQVNYTIITSVVKGWLSASPIIYFKRIDVPPQLNSKQEVTIKEYAKTSSGRFCGATGSIDNENNVIISYEFQELAYCNSLECIILKNGELRSLNKGRIAVFK